MSALPPAHLAESNGSMGKEVIFDGGLPFSSWDGDCVSVPKCDLYESCCNNGIWETRQNKTKQDNDDDDDGYMT